MSRRGQRAWMLGLAVALVVAGALRLPPLRVLVPGPDLQEAYARQAMLALAGGTWSPTWPGHGPGLFTVLRAAFTLWYAIGRMGGWWTDRVDMLASFLGWPYPFLVGARLLVVASALATVALVGWLGRVAFGRTAGIAAALVLAVMFTHVRESLQVWPDVPAALLVLTAVACAYRGRLLAAALAAGAAIAAKHSAAPVLLVVGLALFAADGSFARRGLVAAVALLVGYVALAPTAPMHPEHVLAFFRTQAFASFAVEASHLSLARIVSIGVGWPLVALAVVGAGAALARPGRGGTLLLLAFPVAYLLAIAGAGRLFARYLALAAPFIALFAGEGVAVLARRLGDRRGVLAALLVAGACALPGWRSVVYVRCLGRPDTRIVVGQWIASHAWPRAMVVLPDVLAAPNPVIPGVISPRLGQLSTADQLVAAARDRLRARGAPDFRLTPAGGLGQARAIQFDSPAIVVTATHPVIQRDSALENRLHQALVAARAIAIMVLSPAPDPLPPGVVFDPIDADYVPLVGGQQLERPGPNLIVWRVPATRRVLPFWQLVPPASD